MAFALDPQAVADAAEAEDQHYAVPNFDGLSDVVVDYPENRLQVIRDRDLQRTYLDALMDLHLLVEEYRFEAPLALAVLRDYVVKRDRGETPVVKLSGDERLDRMPWPAETLVVMRRYAREPPSAAELFERPHQQISGGRILSRWFAAQLIDSALYRGVAACARLAILLRCEARLSVELAKSGERRQPSFTSAALNELSTYYAAVPEWQALRELAVNPLFDFIKQERNGFTHERRCPSELHGERAIVYGSQGQAPEEVVPAMDAQAHLALAPAFYNEVLVPAIRLTRAVIVASATTRSVTDG
ncbi:MAG: hypothetical protein ACRDLY_15795 [Thermoleophilaceae bacterium]